MPTYLARGVSARLGTMPLTDTISSKIIPRKSELAKQQAETAERLLQSSKLLKEVPVPLPGDGTQHPLNWLGNTPFVQVQVLRDASSEECSDSTKAPKGTCSNLAREVSELMRTHRWPAYSRSQSPCSPCQSFRQNVCLRSLQQEDVAQDRGFLQRTAL